MENKQEKRQCLQCEKCFSVKQSVLKKGHGKYCSQSCRGFHVWKDKEYIEKQRLSHKGQIPTNLQQLKEIAQLPESRIKASERAKKIAGWNQGLKLEQISGKNHYAWIEDRSLLSQDRRQAYDTRYKWWMKEVKNRDGWKCKILNNDCNGRLEAHHILRWSKHPELRYEVNNGISLCAFHHPRKINDEETLAPLFMELLVTEK